MTQQDVGLQNWLEVLARQTGLMWSLHQGNVTVEGGVVVPRMDDGRGHGALHLALVSSILALSSKVDDPGRGDMSGGRATNGVCLSLHYIGPIHKLFREPHCRILTVFPYIWRQ